MKWATFFVIPNGKKLGNRGKEQQKGKFIKKTMKKNKKNEKGEKKKKHKNNIPKRQRVNIIFKKSHLARKIKKGKKR